ncbi:MAG: hypothetical protein HC855_13680 [Rhizobiales bacterium]|nr:hypothetical protein [Hyphomicrobiales bacterium]
MSGLILKTTDGADGRIDFNAAAAMPQGLLRLLGIVYSDVVPAWARALGSTDLQGSIAMQPGSGGSTSTIEASGASGELRYSGSATLSGLDGSTPITVSGTGALQSVRSGEILRLIAPDHASPPGQAGRIVATISGRLGENLATELKADLYGATFQFSGKMNPAAEAFGAEGSFAASAGNAGEVWAAAGVPATVPAGSLNLRGNVKPAKGGVEITEVTGTVADVPVSGNLTVSGAGRIEGQLISARLVLKDILSAALMPWGAATAHSRNDFRANAAFRTCGRILAQAAATRTLSRRRDRRSRSRLARGPVRHDAQCLRQGQGRPELQFGDCLEAQGCGARHHRRTGRFNRSVEVAHSN